MRLQGKTAVVTGASRGIGAAIARSLVEEGASVLLTARRPEPLQDLAAKLAEGGGTVHHHSADMADAEAVAGLAAQAQARFGQLPDILINNAGVALASPLKRLEQEDWNRVMQLNLTGTYLCTRLLSAGMLSRGWGRIVNIASVAGLHGGRYLSAYCASKHAVVGFTRALAMEFATTGVTVNAVCPGFVETDLVCQSIDRIVATTGRTAEEARHSLEATTPQNRLFQPEEVAYLTVCLCDPRAPGINGQAIAIDGGGVLG